MYRRVVTRVRVRVRVRGITISVTPTTIQCIACRDYLVRRGSRQADSLVRSCTLGRFLSSLSLTTLLKAIEQGFSRASIASPLGLWGLLI